MKQWINSCLAFVKSSFYDDGPSIKRELAAFFAINLVVGVFVGVDKEYIYTLSALIGTLVVGNVVEKFGSNG